jgi:hypothetical protein
VLSATELSSQVTKSNLKQVGILKSLQVTGDTALAEVAYFNSGLGRMGINTDAPNSTLSIVDNNVEIVVGISTDKASPPVRNIYGLSKSTMEKLFCSMNEKSKTKFTCVRYGNVVLSESITLTGQRIIQESALFANTHMNKVLKGEIQL